MYYEEDARRKHERDKTDDRKGRTHLSVKYFDMVIFLSVEQRSTRGIKIRQTVLSVKTYSLFSAFSFLFFSFLETLK